MKYIRSFVLLCIVSFSSQLLADKLSINIGESGDRAVKIAILPFENKTPQANLSEMHLMIIRNLDISTLLDVIPQEDIPNLNLNLQSLDYEAWQEDLIEYIVHGKITKDTNSENFFVTIQILDVFQSTTLSQFIITFSKNTSALAANSISDKVLNQITGVTGMFNTKFVYVTEEPRGKGKLYSLKLSYLNGFEEQTILRSFLPILSPSWSPDNSQIAYVAFNSDGYASVYLHQISTGKRKKLAIPKGITSAPTFSEDGKKLVFSITKNGRTNLAVLDLFSGKVKPITQNRAINTEGAWSPGDNHIVYTSDIKGNPYIFEYNFETGNTIQVTNQGKFNARPRYLSSTDKIIYIGVDEDNIFSLFLLERSKGFLRQLTSGFDVESFDISPNKMYLVFTKTNNGISEMLIMHIQSGQYFPFIKNTRRVKLSEANWSHTF